MKYSSSTYLRDINKYRLYIYKNDNVSITIKKVLNIKSPFSLIEFGKEVKLIDNNYFIVEIIPINGFYICRMFLDNRFNIIEEYYTVTKNNTIIDGIPVYEDLLLSYVKVNGNTKLYHDYILKNNNVKRTDEYDYLNDSLNKIKYLNLNKNDLIKLVKKVVNKNENSN